LNINSTLTQRDRKKFSLPSTFRLPHREGDSDSNRWWFCIPWELSDANGRPCCHGRQAVVAIATGKGLQTSTKVAAQ